MFGAGAAQAAPALSRQAIGAGAFCPSGRSSSLSSHTFSPQALRKPRTMP